MKEIKSPLYLESKRGKRVGDMRNCVECGFRGKGYWRYSESNRGVVFLCDVCKPIVYERSHGIVDAFCLSQQGGRFEGNRRKH